MKKTRQPNKSNLAKTLIVYLGGAWVFIEAFNFLIDKYRLNSGILDLLILLVIFGLPAILIYTWFHQKFTRNAIILQAINGVIAIAVIVFTLANPGKLNPTQLRLIKFKDNQKKLAEKIGSIAILPISNFTGNEDEAYLASGIQDALISELGQLRAIRVPSRTSTLSYANSQKTIKEIASELNVDAIIEGSLLGTGETIKVQLKLFNAFPEEQQLWSQTYDTNMNDILNLYNHVVKNIADEIQLTLLPEQEIKLTKTRKVNPESYKAYLRGMYLLKKLTPESREKGLEFLREAVKIDPGEPLAYAGLALGYLEIAHSPLDKGDALTKAEAAANQAIKLDSTMPEVYAAFGEVYLYSLWKFELAEKHLKKALEINPNLAIVHYHYAWALYLFGRIDEAIVEHKLAQKYDPFDASYASLLGALYYYDGQYDKALEEVNTSFELQKDHSYGYWVLGQIYLKMGKIDEAIEAHKKLAEVHPWWTSALGYTYAVTGHIDEAKRIVEDLEKAGPDPWTAWQCATVNAGLGNKDEAFKWINYEPHHAFAAWCAVLPEFEGLHDDPRFKEFLERLNLPK